MAIQMKGNNANTLEGILSKNLYANKSVSASGTVYIGSQTIP